MNKPWWKKLIVNVISMVMPKIADKYLGPSDLPPKDRRKK